MISAVVSLAQWLGAHAKEVVVLAAVSTVVAWASVTVDDWMEPDREPAPPDTIEKKRTITRTDTVTETVPRTVIRYDTVRATDTMRVPVPADFEMMGVIPTQPLDLSDSEATLTYWTGERWQQNVYEVPRDRWRLSLGLNAFALQDAAVASTSLQARRRTALGWVGVGPAYSAVVTNGVAQTGLGVTVSFESTLLGW